MSCIEIGLRTQKTDDNPYGYAKVNNIPADEVCVLYLGGDGATTDKAANGYAKIIKDEILADVDPSIPVYSVTYNFEGHKQAIARKVSQIKHRTEVLSSNEDIDKILSKATEEEYNPTYVDDLFKKVILPRITLHNGKGKLSTEEACQRIRKLNIVSHCHGGYTALKLEEKMQEAMTLIGYNNDERKKIQSQLLVVAHAPACALGVSKSQFVSFKSVYDSDTPLKNNFFDRYIESRKAEERRRFVAEEDQNIDKIEQNRWFDLKPCFFAGKQGNLFLIKQKYEWIEGEGPFMINSDEHNNVQYKDKSQTKEGRMMAYFAKTILENGIKNSLQQDGAFVPIPSIESLVLDGDEVMASKAAKAFETMRENGKAFREKLFQVAMNTRTKIASKD